MTLPISTVVAIPYEFGFLKLERNTNFLHYCGFAIDKNCICNVWPFIICVTDFSAISCCLCENDKIEPVHGTTWQKNLETTLQFALQVTHTHRNAQSASRSDQSELHWLNPWVAALQFIIIVTLRDCELSELKVNR